MSDLIFALDGIGGGGGHHSDSDDNGESTSPIKKELHKEEEVSEETARVLGWSTSGLHHHLAEVSAESLEASPPPPEEEEEKKEPEDILSLAQQLERLRSLATPSPLPTPTSGTSSPRTPRNGGVAQSGVNRLLKQQAFLAETDREIKAQQTVTLAPSASTPFIFDGQEEAVPLQKEIEEPSKDQVVPPILERQALKVSTRDFQLMRVIGKGAYGKVFLVRKVSGKDHQQLYILICFDVKND